MAQHLASIHGTEEDRVNCPFYFKIGACRHGDRCSRKHHKPAFSPTLLVQHLYQHPVRLTEQGVHKSDAEHVDDFFSFFEDMFAEFSKQGRIDQLHVVDNLGDHMIGHVYVKFYDEEDAQQALHTMHNRYYDSKPMLCEYSPVTDFREARCRDYDEGDCSRGGYCNFLHLKPVPGRLIQDLQREADDWWYQNRKSRREDRRDDRRREDRQDRRRDRDHDRGGRDYDDRKRSRRDNRY